MTAADLRAWQAEMSYTQRQAAEALGMTLANYSAAVLGKTNIDKRTSLACAALKKKIKPYGANHGPV